MPSHSIEENERIDAALEASRGRISGPRRVAHSGPSSKASFQMKKSELKLCAIVIDGIPSRGRQMIAAIGVAHNGEKTVLGLREGSVGGGEATCRGAAVVQRCQPWPPCFGS